MSVVLRAVLCVVATLVALVPVPVAQADRGGGDDGRGGEVRVRTTARCGHGARTRLELRARDGRIRLDWDLERGRAGERWRVVAVQESGVVGRRIVRLDRAGGAELRWTLRDLEGADRIEVRAGGPRGTTCTIGATLRG
jgi:hypothetical protein